MGKCAQKRLVNFSGKGGVWRLCGWTVDQARPRIDCKPPYNHCVQAVVLCQLGAFESTRTFVNSYLRQLVPSPTRTSECHLEINHDIHETA